jgi:hypothetical protein
MATIASIIEKLKERQVRALLAFGIFLPPAKERLC